MNPGKVVRPYRLDENLTRRGWSPREPRTVLPLPGRRRQVRPGGLPLRRRRQVPRRRGRGDVPELPGHPRGGALHPGPGPAADGDGRGGDVITDGWHSTEVRDALDLCLACKGCRKDCPVERGHGHLQGGVPGPPLRGPAPARGALLDGLAARCWPGWPRPRPALVNAVTQAARARDRWPNGPAASTAPRTLPLLRPADVHRAGTHGAGGSPTRGDGACSGRTRSPTTSTPRSGRPP